MKILIIGSGGNGQTYFMKFLKSNNVNINDIHDRDNIKHLPSPNLLKIENKDVKCIFLYNDPYLSILSHFRRNWAHRQLIKLGNPYNLTKKNTSNIKSFIQKVNKEKKDLYGIEKQFYEWFNAELHFPIYFLDFNDILNEKDNINFFVEKNLDYTSFSYNTRNSTNDNSSDFYNKIYDKMKKNSKNKNKIIFDNCYSNVNKL